MIAHLPSIGNPKEGALLKRLALQTAEVPTAAGSRTGARRTDLQNRGQATSRPREAHEESGTQSPYSPNRAGGVQRGWQSTEGTLTPPLALFASFSGARKKGLHKRKQAQKKRQPLRLSLPCSHECAALVCSFAAAWAVSRIRGILERRVRFVLAGTGQGFHPCTPPGANAAPGPAQGALAP